MSVKGNYTDPNYPFKEHKMSYLLTFLMVALSGNPIFRIYNVELVYILFAFFLFFMALNRGMLFIYNTPAFRTTVAVVILLYFVQYIDIQYNQVNAYIGFILKLFIIYSMLRLIAGFEIIFVKVMYFVALVGIIGFAIYLVYPQVTDYGVTIMGENESYFYHKSLYIYTFLLDGLNMRNSGMFSEPGLFAGTLNIALIVLLSLKEALPVKTYNKYLFVFIMAILSTSSTQGYLVLAILLFYMLYVKINSAFAMTQAKRVAMIIGLVILLVAVQYAFEEIPFLNQKIQDQSALVSNEEGNFEITRWGGFLTSLQYIFEKPLWGWGVDVISSINSRQTQKVLSSGTGMTDIILKLGLPFFLFLLHKIYRCFGIMFSSRGAAVFYLIVFILLIQGEPFFNFPLIYLFYFTGFKNKLSIRQGLRYAS